MVGVLLYAVLVRLPPALTTFWLSLGVAAAGAELLPDAYLGIARQWVRALLTGREMNTLPDRLKRIAAVMAEMARAFRIEEEAPQAETHLVETVVTTVCKTCSLRRSCWEENFYRSYRGVVDLTANAATEVVTSQHLRGDLARRCIRPDTVAHAVNLAANRERERAQVALRIRESRALAELQLTGLSQLVGEMAEDWQDLTQPRRRGRSQFFLGYAVGVAQRPRRGGVVTGDTGLVRELSPGRVVFGLSDGMGVGPRAAWESGTAMSLLEQLLLAGFSQVLAVRAVNTTLLLRSVDDHFATLDLVLLDRTAHGVELVKVAAAPTFLRRGGRVEIIRAHSLPVGIVNDVSISPVYHTIAPGDWVVLVTDGVLEYFQDQGEERLRQFLEKLPGAEPQTMAETILSYMLGDHRDGRDDASVMVIEVRSGHRPGRSAASAAPATWQPIAPVSLRGRRRR